MTIRQPFSSSPPTPSTSVHSSSSPPLASSSSPRTTPPASQHDDPFLAQSQSIPLTAADRQEGYDVGLLQSKPRGISQRRNVVASSSLHHSPGSIGRGGGGPSSSSAAAAKQSTSLRTSPTASLTRVNTNANPNDPEGVLNLSPHRVQPSTSYALYEDVSKYAASSPPARPWYKRPLVLVLIGVLVVAVAAGAGVGASMKKGTSSDEVTSTGTTSRSVVSTHTSNTSPDAVVSNTISLSSTRILDEGAAPITTAFRSTATSSPLGGEVPIEMNPVTLKSDSMTHFATSTSTMVPTGTDNRPVPESTTLHPTLFVVRRTRQITATVE